MLYGQQPPDWWYDSHPDSLLHLQTKFGNIVAEVNQVAGEMVFTLVRAARGGFDEDGEEEEEYYEEEQVSEAPAEGIPPSPDLPPSPNLPPSP